MKVIKITQSGFEDFRDVQIRPRFDWPATFSCNEDADVWPFITLGYTDHSSRMLIERGDIPHLDEIVDAVLDFRPLGGRFFISDDGVFIRPEGSPQIQVARFAFI